MKTRETLRINEKGHLEIGGCDTVELSDKFGTPLYVMDESHIVSVCESYKKVLASKYPNSLICYASKAFSCKAIYKVVSKLGLGADVVSGGELHTALTSGMSAQSIYMHGNNKLSCELELAVKSDIHAVVIDSLCEIELLDKIATSQSKVVKVLIRVNPGIDAHTHHFIQTTRVDSKFGFSIADGSALFAAQKIKQYSSLEFIGIHCHIGSQIFDVKPFELAVEKMTDFIKALNTDGISVKELNLGGGYGITYTDEDKPLEPYQYVDAIVNKLLDCIQKKSILPPRLILEPGRSIVGEAGITLYTVGAVKDIKNVKKYISVDGGMFENPRFALYQASYEAMLANRASEPKTEVVTIAGKCCESGDILIADAKMPAAKRGDILAVLSTGAYNYSMASNYNRNAIPPVVLVSEKKAEYIVKPQSYQDIAARDVIPARLEDK